MTRKKNGIKPWQANLKLPLKHTSKLRKPTIKDVTDCESESDSDFKAESKENLKMESDFRDIALKKFQSYV